MINAETQTGVPVHLTGEDGNIFNLVGIASKALKRAGFADAAKEMTNKVFASESYDQALQIVMSYVEVD